MAREISTSCEEYAHRCVVVRTSVMVDICCVLSAAEVRVRRRRGSSRAVNGNWLGVSWENVHARNSVPPLHVITYHQAAGRNVYTYIYATKQQSCAPRSAPRWCAGAQLLLPGAVALTREASWSREVRDWYAQAHLVVVNATML